MDKKKIGLIAIVLFLIIGLGSFVFANPDNQENFEEGDIEEREGQGSDQESDDVESSDDESSDEEDGNTLTAVDEQDITTYNGETGYTTGPSGDGIIGTGNNTNNNGTGSGNGSDTGTTPTVPVITDDYYAEALKAVENAESSLTQGDVDYAADLVGKVTNQSQKDELNNRLEAVQDIIDVTALIERLEEKVANSTNRDGILDSIDYRDEEKIEELVNNLIDGSAKDNLANRLETVNKILNDNARPVISGIVDNSFTDEDSVTLTISDTTDVTTTVTLNGNPIDFTDSFTEEGTYVVTVVDEAFNEATLTFTIDRTNPVVGGVEDGKYYNTTVAVTIDDTNPGTVHLKRGEETVKPYKPGDPITEEGTYTVYVSDKAGNKSKTITFVIDKHVEEQKWVYILNVSDENNRKTIRNGQTLRVEVNFDEELTELPVLTIGNSQSVTFRKCNETDYGKYVCIADLTIDNTVADLEDGKEIPFTITNIYDKAGNTITLDNSDVTNTKNYGQVTYDGTAPVIRSLGIVNLDQFTDETGRLYAKYGDTVRVRLYFDEELGTEPTVRLGGTEFIATYRENSPKYAYYADIKLTEDMNLSDGILSFEVYGYADAIGNVGVNLTQDDINEETYPSVTIDNTKAVVKAANILVDGDINEQKEFYAKVGDTIYSYVRFSEKLKELPTFTLINDGNEYVVEDVVETGPNDAGEYTYSIRYTIDEDTKMSDGKITMLVTSIQDLAGNTTDDVEKPTNKHVVYLDTTVPSIKILGITGFISENEDAHYITYGKKVRVLTYFDEKLATNPIVKIGNKEFETYYTEESSDLENNSYAYYLDVAITEELGLSEGEIQFSVYGIRDLADNEGRAYTNADITYSEKQEYEKRFDKVILDNSNPVFVGLEEGGVYNPAVIQVDDTSLKTITVYHEDESYEVENGYVIEETGKYKITAVDEMGRETTINIKVDTQVPTYTFNDGTIEYNGVYGILNLKLHDENRIASVVINGTQLPHTGTYVDINDGDAYTFQNGTNTVVVTDNAGNTATYTFVVDKKAPTYTFNGDVVDYNDVYKTLNLKLHDENGIASIVINGTKLPHTGTYVDINDGDAYTFQNGTNTVVVTDNLGNTATYTFVVDKKAPTYTFNDGTVEHNGVYGTLNLKLHDENGIASVVINGTQLPHTGYYVDINDGHAYTFRNGLNTVVVTDNLGNTATYTFNVDKAAPTYSFNGGTTESNGVYGTLNLKLHDENGIASVVINGTQLSHTGTYVDINDGHAYTFQNGLNTVVVTDNLGNTATYTFNVDKTVPTYSFNAGTVVNDGVYQTLNLKLYDENGIASVVINGTQLPHTGTYVDINDGHAYTFQNGENSVVVTDNLGNSVTYTFNVAK